MNNRTHAPPATLPPAPPKVAPFPEQAYEFTNDVFFGANDDLGPVPVALHPPRPDVGVARAFDTPPPPYRYTQPGEAGGEPRFEHRPGPTRHELTQARLGLDQDSDARGSVGTGIQLLALGPQNYTLDINPQMSFFRAAYRRHTACTTECFEQDVRLPLGGTVSLTIQRRGDMLGDVMVEVQLPNLGIPGGAWVDAVGYVLMTRVRLVMDDVVIHDHERLWYDLVDKLFAPHGRKAAIDAMIGRGRHLPTDRAHTVVVPLKFFCCTNHYPTRQFLPLASAASRSALVVELSTESLQACVQLPAGAQLPAVASLEAKVLTEQTFVEQDEQRAAWQRRSVIMVDAFQDVDALNYEFGDGSVYTMASVTMDLREINLPVKSLIFVAYDENAVAEKRYFQYEDCVHAASLVIGAAERFAPRGGDYFSLVQTYQHSTRCTSDRVHLYSFALDAAQRQPCGALNFAAVEKPTMRVQLRGTGGKNIKVKAFAHCINWLAVQKGDMTFVFSV